jgi:voltage-gated potassium channel
VDESKVGAMNSVGKMVRLVMVLVFVLSVGTIGYWWIEKWSLFDSFYMTVITVATIGYGEVHTLSSAGRVFTVVLVFMGIGAIAYGMSEMSRFILEGEMTGLIRKRNMEKRISKLTEHYILCGCDRTGRHVLEELVRTQRPCVVVEKDPNKLQKLLEEGIPVVEGDADDDVVLRAAGIERARGLVAALPTDPDNLFVVFSARGLNPKLRIVAKVNDVHAREKFLRSGADSAISTNFIGGLRMASELIRPATVGFLDSMLRTESALRVEDVLVGAAFAGRTIGQLDPQIRGGVVLVALRHGEEQRFNPAAETVLRTGDTLVVIGNPDELGRLRSALA